jgi:hypothetical protein
VKNNGRLNDPGRLPLLGKLAMKIMTREHHGACFVVLTEFELGI